MVLIISEWLIPLGCLSPYAFFVFSVILTEDPHQSEYIAVCDRHREWISGRVYLWSDCAYHALSGAQVLWTC